MAGSLSSGLHHARRARGNGYCTFNGLALAARAALAFGARNVLILDLDAHCGGGTSELRGDAPQRLDRGRGGARLRPLRAPHRHTLDVVSAARQYLPVLKSRLEGLASRAPAFDLCLYNAGMDPHQGCPIGGLPGIDGAVLQDREAIVFEWCRERGIPIAFSLAGGYIGPGLTQAGLTELHRLTLAAGGARRLAPATLRSANSG